MVNCSVEAMLAGWFVTFPADRRMGLLLESDSEKMSFAVSCNVDLDGRDLLLSLDLGEITECPSYWFDAATEHFDCPF